MILALIFGGSFPAINMRTGSSVQLKQAVITKAYAFRIPFFKIPTSWKKMPLKYASRHLDLTGWRAPSLARQDHL